LWPEEIRGNPPPGISYTTTRLSSVDSKFILDIANAKVAGEARILTTESNEVIANMQGLHGVRDPLNHHFLEPKLRVPKFLPGRSFIVAGATEPNYYHWLFDSLPRLHLARSAGIDLDSIDHFLLMRKPPGFVFETLSLMGIPSRKYVTMHSKEVLQCERLMATEMPTPMDAYPEWVLEFLKGLLAPRGPQTPNRFLYLSRNDARSRRVTNEAELSEKLNSLGFDIVSTSGLSVRDQSILFASARMIVAPHGAGLTNILFSAPGTTVLELYNPAYNARSFPRLGESLGHRFSRMECSAAPHTTRLAPQEQDMVVPIEETLEIIRREIALLES
jgi:capsular polysaccharide biosynthesis protein